MLRNPLGWGACVGVLVASASIGTLGCAHGAAGHELPRDTVPIGEILREALILEAPAFAAEIRGIDLASLRVEQEQSQAMSGAVYYWTAFAPRRSGDLLITAVAASAGDSAIVLRSSADWHRLARESGWIPGAELVLTACEELVRTTSRFRSFVWPPVMFRDTTQLLDQSISGSAMLRTRLTTPSVSGSGLNWSVQAWFFESGRTALYECVFDGAEPVSYREIEVFPRTGLPRIGS